MTDPSDPMHHAMIAADPVRRYAPAFMTNITSPATSDRFIASDSALRSAED